MSETYYYYEVGGTQSTHFDSEQECIDTAINDFRDSTEEVSIWKYENGNKECLTSIYFADQ